MTAATGISLPQGLRDALTKIAKALVEGPVSDKVDYGMLHYYAYLTSPDDDEAKAVRAFLDRQVRELTGGTKTVLFAEKAYLDIGATGGLYLAMVPVGHDARSPEAQYLGLYAGIGGLYLARRASKQKITDRLRRDEANDRRRGQQVSGELLAIELTEVVRRHVLSVYEDLKLTELRFDDIFYAAPGTGSTLRERLSQLSLEQLCTILVILGRPDLPSYQ